MIEWRGEQITRICGGPVAMVGEVTERARIIHTAQTCGLGVKAPASCTQDSQETIVERDRTGDKNRYSTKGYGGQVWSGDHREHERVRILTWIAEIPTAWTHSSVSMYEG